jgi:hypothetical protein
MNGSKVITVTAGVATLLLVLIWILSLPQKKCPSCGELFRRFRKPANLRQALWGGWTCSKCGCEVDRKGRIDA